MSISFSGLASGLDSGSIIDQMVAAERASQGPITTRKLELGRQKIVVSDLASKLSALASKAKAFTTAADARSFTATTSDSTRIGVAVSGSAQPGTYAIRVNSLARAETTVSRTFLSANAGVLGAGSVSIAAGTDTPVTITYGATDSLAAIADKINSSGARATASVLHDGTTYRLMINARDSGTAAALSFTDGGDSLALANPGNVKVIAEDAEIELNGITITRGTNVLSDVLPGVTLTLSKTHLVDDADTVIGVNSDAKGVRERVQGLLDSYNAVADVLDSQLRYDGVAKGQDTLFGDSMLRGLQLRFGALTTSERTHDAGTTSLGNLGISRDTHGKLTINSTKFDAAVAADPSALEDLLLGDGQVGMGKALSDLASEYTKSTDGLLAGKTKALDARIKGYTDQIDRIESSAVRLESTLSAQFSALEQLMVSLRNQQNYLSSLF
jgi:flagellar hook-associated protein 2